MTKYYKVHFVQTVSTTVSVEADDYEQAIERAYDSDDMPGPISYGAFGRALVDESGEWEPTAVYAEDGTLLWEEDR